MQFFQPISIRQRIATSWAVFEFVKNNIFQPISIRQRIATRLRMSPHRLSSSSNPYPYDRGLRLRRGRYRDNPLHHFQPISIRQRIATWLR